MQRDRSTDGGFMSFNNPTGLNFMNIGNNVGGNDERTPRNCELLAPVPQQSGQRDFSIVSPNNIMT